MSGASAAGPQPEIRTETLFDRADALALLVPSSCGRSGRCRECVVEVQEGVDALAPPTAAEAFLGGRFRLACQARVLRPGAPVRFTPLRRAPQIVHGFTGASESPADLDPAVTRAGDEVFRHGSAVDIWAGALVGLAVDLGTTTVAVEFVDLATGAVLGASAFENPQRFGGSDVLARITYETGRTRGAMRLAVVAALNAEIAAFTARTGLRRRTIQDIVIAGNTTMRDLFFGLDVEPIGQRPYRSLTETDFRAGRRGTTALDAAAIDLGLRAGRATRVFGLPVLASHVGGDVAADLLALGFLDPAPEPRMLVDIGTNTEVVVAVGERIVCASCPAGPAFEGRGVEYGMPGVAGAIERIAVGPDGRATGFRVIGGGPPQGFCGSGLVDLIAGLRAQGVMGPKGTLPGIPRGAKLAVVPVAGLTLSREDASTLAQAKAANFCGQAIVLRRCGLRPADIGRMWIAGGFANWLDLAQAQAIGFLAPVPAERIVKAGNAALRGARLALLSVGARRRLDALAARIEHVELETEPDFFELFVEGCRFEPMPDMAPLGETVP